jgi:hypothetical protein
MMGCSISNKSVILVFIVSLPYQIIYRTYSAKSLAKLKGGIKQKLSMPELPLSGFSSEL